MTVVLEAGTDIDKIRAHCLPQQSYASGVAALCHRSRARLHLVLTHFTAVGSFLNCSNTAPDGRRQTTVVLLAVIWVLTEHVTEDLCEAPVEVLNNGRQEGLVVVHIKIQSCAVIGQHHVQRVDSPRRLRHDPTL